ncbi:MAG: hypothetical protein CMG74_05650 [Candidatus Marinimicrobia bacterium]|nr:hypothetical protein [Candidatus Neomarinimicrobiota bacterium]
MKKYKMIILTCSLFVSVMAKEKPGLIDNSSSGFSRFLAKTAALDQYSLINIGNMEYWVNEDGTSCHTAQGGSGGIYPRSTAGAIYLDGILVGGYQGGNLKVSGQIYRTGTVKGYIGSGGVGTDGVRVYRIRKDWASLTPAMIRQETAEYFEIPIGSVSDADMQVVLDNYATDWAEWPTQLGAPFYDLNGNGIYEPSAGETPGVANADQVLWFVCNDGDPTTTADLYGTEPMNIEMQMTLWGYNQPGAGLGQIVFKQVRIINRSSDDITDAYISQWSDPDLGDYGNDLVGVDTSLSLMYAYNGEVEDAQYAAFGLAPAAIGYDYFAGPKVYTGNSADTAIFNLEKVAGWVNLPASSFGYFSAGGTYSDPGPYGNVEAAREYYNLMRGYAPIDDLDNPTAWVNDEGNDTKYPYAGDPVAGTGHLDSSPGDRRMLINAGPFTLAAGDTQDVVEAIIGGLGDSQLSSITDMKFTDVVAQALFDDLFQSVPSPPAAPQVSVTTTEESIILNWGDNQASIDATEDPAIAGYAFEGYNVYQLPTATSSLDDAVKVATYDLENGVTEVLGNVFLPEFGTQVSVPVQSGLDVGVKRYFVATQDYTTGKPLYTGSEYYFAVTAYNYNAEPALIEDKALESAAAVQAIVVQPPPPGTRYESPAGTGIVFTKTGGQSDGQIEGVIVDPDKVTGDTYTVGFAISVDTTWTEPIWYVKNSAGVKVQDDEEQLGDLSDYDDQIIVDGFKIKVSGPPVGINPFRAGVAYGAGSATSATYLAGWDFSGDRWISGTDWGAGTGRLFGGLSNGFEFFGSDMVEGGDFFDVRMDWAGCETCDPAVDTTSEMMMAKSKAEGQPWSKAVMMDRAAGYVVSDTLADVPWIAYNTETSPETQLKTSIVEFEPSGSRNFLWDMGWNHLAPGFDGLGGREYTFILNDPYGDGDYSDYITGGLAPYYNNVLYAFWPAPRGSRGYLHAAFTFSIFASNVNVVDEDYWTFKAPAKTVTAADKATDYEKINVYPNPYYATNSQEANRFDNFVTFTHMPNVATVRIFSIDGTLVRKLDKNDTEQFLRWDLRNSTDLPVASGPYIAYIESDDMAKSKTLKIYVVQRNQLVQYY